MLSRFFGAVLVLLSSFIVVPTILFLDIMKNIGMIEFFFVIIACVLIFVGAIIYIFREKRFS